MKYSIQSAKLDSLSCSNSFCLASRAGPDDSKRQVCMASIWRQKTNLFQVGEARDLCFLTIHLEEVDSELQTPYCLVGHPWLV